VESSGRNNMYIICIKDLILISGAKFHLIISIFKYIILLLLKNKTKVRIFIFSLKSLLILSDSNLSNSFKKIMIS